MSLYSLLAVGNPPIELLMRLSSDLSTLLAAEVRIADFSIDPQFAYLQQRDQYFSTRILARIDSLFAEFRGRVLGVTEVDLCIPILTFVFGEAQLNGRSAIISTRRLKQSYYGLPENEEIFYERICKEAMHELGHTLGLFHCDKWECVMHTSTVADEIDIKGMTYCSNCQTKLLSPVLKSLTRKSL